MSEQFLATAQVLVRPSTAGFASALVTEINAAILAAEKSIKPVTVPVLAGGVVASEAAKTAAVLEKQANAARSAGVASVQAGKGSTDLAHANLLASSASQKLALAQGLVANAASRAGAAQITATRSTAASVAAQNALNAELRIGNIARIQAADAVVRLAAAQELEASTALAAARAQAIHASRLEFVSRGAGTQAVSLFGLRGAALAANAAFIAGAAGAIALAKSVGVAANLEKQLNVLRVTSGATADEMERISQVARELGSDIALPAVSATDAAVAMTELAKAGFSVQDSIEGARGVLLLATAAEIDNANATNIVANALNSFGLAGAKATEVADLLAAGSIEAQGSISDMGAALTSAASVSKQVGISLEDTVALLTILAKNGIQGAAGGTALRVALLRLVAPSSAAADQLEKLGVAIRDSQGRIRPEIFADLEEATRGLTARQRDLALATIFGTRGIRAQVNIARDGVSGLNAMRDAITQGGDAQKLASAQTQGFTGSVENLKNQLEEAGITIGNLIKGPLNLLVKGLALDVQAFNKLATEVGSLAAKFDDVTQPAQNIVSSIQDAGASVGEFLDDATKGIPILDGFFNTLDKGAESTITLASSFKAASQGVVDFVGKIQSQIQKLKAESEAKAGAKASAAGAFGKIAGLEEQILDTGGSRAAELALRKQELAILDQKIAAGNLTIENRRKLKRERERVLSAIESIESEMASDAERAATEVASAQQRADSAFLDMLSGKRAGAQNLILRAGGNEALKDDIRFNEDFRDLLRKQIEQVRKTVKDAQTRVSELRDLTRQLIQVKAEIQNLRQQAREQARQDRQDRLDRQDESVQLDIELAQITENRAGEIRAHQARINLLRQRIKNAKGHQLEIKRLKVEIAREKAAIRDLKDEVIDRGKAFKELTFSFLQTQQGFAANLLGNLIPGGMTGGLVGGPAQGMASAAFTPQAGVQKESAVAAGRDRGISSGQGDTTNHILRSILRALQNLNGRAGHPEARYQRATGGSAMDVM